jgi:hypothetical protein
MSPQLGPPHLFGEESRLWLCCHGLSWSGRLAPLASAVNPNKSGSEPDWKK